MIDVKTNLAKQLDGPRINTVVTGISHCFNKFYPYLDYLSKISIARAQEVDLETLGYVIGFIRPLVPNEVILEKLFRFSSFLIVPTFSETGFSAINGSIQGGNFSQEDLVLSSNKLPLTQYRKLLDAVARLKWNKNSIYSIDNVCRVFHTTYDIVYTEEHDILVIFKDSLTGEKISLTNLYVANLFFVTIFNVTPRVTCVRL